MKLRFLKVFVIVCFLPSLTFGCSMHKTTQSEEWGDRPKAWKKIVEDYKSCRKGFIFNDKKTCYDRAEYSMDEYLVNHGLQPMRTDQLRNNLSDAAHD